MVTCSYNLGQNKKEQYTCINPLPPPPKKKTNDEGARRSKPTILASMKWGEGWSKCSIHFVQDSSRRTLVNSEDDEDDDDDDDEEDNPVKS